MRLWYCSGGRAKCGGGQIRPAGHSLGTTLIGLSQSGGPFVLKLFIIII